VGVQAFELLLGLGLDGRTLTSDVRGCKGHYHIVNQSAVVPGGHKAEWVTVIVVRDGIYGTKEWCFSSTSILKDDGKVGFSGKENEEFKKLKHTKRPSCALRLLPPTW
jgi:hypothetical protein